MSVSDAEVEAAARAMFLAEHDTGAPGDRDRAAQAWDSGIVGRFAKDTRAHRSRAALEAAAAVRGLAEPPTCRVCDGVGRLAVGQRLADGTYETRECHNCHGTAIAEREEAEPSVADGFVCINGQTVDVGTLSSFLFQCLWKVSALETRGEHASAAIGVAAWLEQSDPVDNPITERMRASAAEVQELSDAYNAAGREPAEPSVPLSAVAEYRRWLEEEYSAVQFRNRDQVYVEGCMDSLDGAITRIDAAFPQLKEQGDEH